MYAHVLQARVKSDMERLEREKLELADRITSLQASIFKGSEKLDQFKLLMNWNQEELDQWAVAQKQKEEDNQALEKYRWVMWSMLRKLPGSNNFGVLWSLLCLQKAGVLAGRAQTNHCKAYSTAHISHG